MSVRVLVVLLLVKFGHSLYGQLYFPGSDVLSGDLKALDTARGYLQWNYPGVDKPFQFETTAVSNVILNHDEDTVKLPGKYRVTLTQGDVLQGEITDIDESTVTVDAGFAEPFVLPKTTIHRIDRDWDRSHLVYSGPNNADEWKVGYRGTNWKFEPDEKALVCTSYSSTGREIENIPNKFRFELQLTLKDEPILHLFLCADNPRNGGDNYYYLKLTSNVIDFERRLKDHPRTYISLPKESAASGAQGLFQGKTELRLAVEVDRLAKRLKLFLDGKLYASYRDPSPMAADGSSIILTSYGSGSLEARDVRLYALDRLTVLNHEVPLGNALLEGGDTLATDLLAKHQLGQLLSVQFHPLGDVAKNQPRCELLNGGQLGGDLRVGEDGMLAVQHNILGACAFPLSWVRKFTFRPNDARSGYGRVFFKNGDQLGGVPHSWDESNGLQWRRPGEDALLEFPAYSLAEMRLEPEADPAPSQATLRLVGGDQLPGKVTNITPETIILETSFSKPMELKALVVQRMDFTQMGHLYASGPDLPITRWTKNGIKSDWQFNEEGVLVGRGLGGIGQAVSMPERGRLDIELSWKGFLDASITLFARDLSRSSQPRSYRFHCESERVTLFRGLTAAEVQVGKEDDDPLRNRRLDEQLERFSAQFGGGASRKLGSPVAVDFRRHERVEQFSVCWDMATAEISFVLNGTVLRTWNDPAGLVMPASGLIFQQHNQSTAFRIHRFMVEEWNGVLPEPPLTMKESKELTETRLRLRNQDEFAAVSLSLKEATAPLMLGAELGPLAIPLDRLRWIQYPNRKIPIEHQKGMAVEAELVPAGSCRFFLHKLEKGALHVGSPYFGENTLQLSGIRRLTFDLQDRHFWQGQKR